MKPIWLAILLFAGTLHAQTDPLEGLWQGYDGEWAHVSKQLISLAEAIPADKYAWRPGPGVRSTSEVMMHIALANYSLLGATGVKMPADVKSPSLERTVAAKADVIGWLKRSLEAVKTAHLAATPAQMQLRVRINGRNAIVDGIYLRILVHANEHMGQLIAYARVNGVVPPWSAGSEK